MSHPNTQFDVENSYPEDNYIPFSEAVLEVFPKEDDPYWSNIQEPFESKMADREYEKTNDN